MSTSTTLGVTGWGDQRPTLRRGLGSPAVTLLVLAVSDNAVVIGADELHVDLVTGATRLVQKVFEGRCVVGGLAGTAHTTAGSLLDCLDTAVASADSLPEAVAVFEQLTAPFLHDAVGQWRAHVGAGPALEEFATVVLAGPLHRRPAGIVLWCAEMADGVRWHRGDSAHPLGESSFVGAYSGVTEQVHRRTSRAHLDHAVDLLTTRGQVTTPTPLPPADASGHDVVTFVRDTVALGIASEHALARPAYWPGGPVLAGVPRLAGLEYRPHIQAP
jgi:hypothetical protein